MEPQNTCICRFRELVNRTAQASAGDFVSEEFNLLMGFGQGPPEIQTAAAETSDFLGAQSGPPRDVLTRRSG